MEKQKNIPQLRFPDLMENGEKNDWVKLCEIIDGTIDTPKRY